VLHAHKAILVARSCYFKALFLNGMQESNSGQTVDEIHINEFSYDIIKSLLQWMYTDTISLPPHLVDPSKDLVNSSAFALWSAATFFCLGNLAACLENEIAKLLSPENVSQFWNTVNKLDCKNLQNLCEVYFISNVEKIIQTDTFLQLEKELVIRAFYPNNRPGDPKQLLCGKTRVPTAICVSAVPLWLRANSPEFLRANLADSLPLKNRSKPSSNSPMQVQ